MRLSRTLLAAITIAVAGQAAQAQTSLATAETSVNMSISSLNSLSFAASISLSITSGTAGAALSTTASSVYDIISNATDSKITGVIDTDMPTGASLSVALTAPTGATSAGAVALSSTALDLVTGISNVSETNLGVTYTFGADVNTPTSLTRTVTYVLTAGA